MFTTGDEIIDVVLASLPVSWIVLDDGPIEGDLGTDLSLDLVDTIIDRGAR